MLARSITLLLFAWIASYAEAATKYRLEQSRSDPAPESRQGSVIEDGHQARIDFDPADSPAAYTSILVRADGTLVALNSVNRTWYTMADRRALGIFGLLLNVPRATGPLHLNVKVEPRRTNADEVFVLTFSYVLEGKFGEEKMAIDIAGSTRAWTCSGEGAAPRAWNPAEFSTGLAALDDAARDEFAQLKEPVCRTETTITQQFRGGTKRTQMIERRAFDFEPAPVSPATFTVPSDYVNQEPQYGFPSINR